MQAVENGPQDHTSEADAEPVRRKQSYDIEPSQLKTLLNMGMSLSSIAKSGMLGTKNRKTLFNHCKKHQIPTPRARFTDLDAGSLETIIRGLNQQHPNSGAEEIRARLKINGHIVPRAQVREYLRSVDPLGTAARWAQVTQRRKYSVRTSNSIWHVDNNHALLR